MAAAAPANAAQLTQTYKCTYPLIGERGLTVNIDAAIPATWQTGTPTPPFAISASAEADLGTYQGLDLIGANKISGTSKASSTVTAPNFTLPVQVPIAIPEVTKPAAPPLKFEGLTGETPSLTFTQTGVVNITVDKLDLNIAAKRADGSAIVLPPVVPVDSDGNPNTFDVPCVLDPAGQNKTLQNTTVTPPAGDTVKPSVPGEPFITSIDDVTPTSIKLQWGASTDNVGVEGYEIRYEGQTKTVGDVTETTLTGLTPGGLYEIDVRAFDAAGNFSDFSPAIVLELPTDVDQLPSAPGTLTGNATGETSISLSWGAATDDVFVAGYEVFQDGAKVKDVTTTSTTITGLTKATAYKFKVRAIDAPGLQTGPFGNEITISTQGDNPPSKPANLAGTPTRTSVALTWTASTDDKGVAGYDVYKDGVKVDTVTGTSKTITGLSPSTAYKFKVQAKDTIGQTSDFSDEITSTTLADTPPSKPAGLAGTPTKTSVALSWTASTDDVGVAGYDVFQNGVKIDTVTGTSKTVTGLALNTEYKFKVQAKDTIGQTSVFSDEITTKTLSDTPPTTPTGLAGTPTASTVALTWAASTDDVSVAGYDVYKDGVKIDTVTGTSKTVTGLSQSTAYKFKVQAKDSIGQTSAFSTEITVTTTDNTIVKYGYTLKGTSVLKTLTTGPVPLTGGINADLTLATGDFTGDLTLNSTKANLKVLGTLPVKADIGFEQTDKTRGTLKSGVLTATAKFRVRLKQLYLFGVLPIAGDGQCRTKSSSIANLKSTAAFFDPLQGGNLKGTYGISDLTGCGLLESFISPLAKGGGNTIDINLTPKP
ncbi:fibronectin type III domain-containing protein [Svornostia abyssi]|uniref:Fibronectin type III domain-containing protein n=1 Tax=Svornostia abyssi TaxID=2898438 RepID=A0ABY5PIL3_9ACTN|nr:fibronectin type III domain-containing protein [Parviterribacteraceae bacterium J379]